MSIKLFALLILLYFAQGIPAGFSAQALPVILRQQGASLGVIGLLNLLALPWLLKALWAPWIDRLHARRVALAVIQVLVAALLVLLASQELEFWWAQQLNGLLLVILSINMLMACHDIVTDGSAVRLLHSRGVGMGNTLQVAGYKLGMIAGGSALLWLLAEYSWQLALIAIAALLLLLTLALTFFNSSFAALSQGMQGVHQTHGDDQTAQGWRVIISFIQSPGMWLWLLVIMSYRLNDALASSMLKPMWVDAGLATTAIAQMGLYAVLASLAGALLAGIVFQPKRIIRQLILAGALQSLALLVYVMCWQAQAGTMWWQLTAVFEQFIDGYSTVLLFAAMMLVCRQAFAGSDYTLQASLFLLITGSLKVLSGYLAQSLGYSVFLLFAASLIIWPILMLNRLSRRQWFDAALDIHD